MLLNYAEKLSCAEQNLVHRTKVLCKKGIFKNLFMIFITFKTRQKIFLKIEKTWFLLVYWVAKYIRLILLSHFHLSMSYIVTL